MSKWSDTTEESRMRWETNADFWDKKMGEHSNRYHREIVRPDTEKMLSVEKGDRVLDICCGNGNFSKRLVDLGADVVAFDFSSKMIDIAKQRCSYCIDNIKFYVIDATNYKEIMKLKSSSAFDKAVANMAVMDISDVAPLFTAIYELLKPGGIFVFSTIHPCFQPPSMRKITETEDLGNKVRTRHGIQIFEYIRSQAFEGIGIVNQPVPQFYYHRPLNELFGYCFEAGFVINGVTEPVFNIETSTSNFDWYSIPPVIIVRLLKDNG